MPRLPTWSTSDAANGARPPTEEHGRDEGEESCERTRAPREVVAADLERLSLLAHARRAHDVDRVPHHVLGHGNVAHQRSANLFGFQSFMKLDISTPIHD
jgi:hypothetical protein